MLNLQIVSSDICELSKVQISIGMDDYSFVLQNRLTYDNANLLNNLNIFPIYTPIRPNKNGGRKSITSHTDSKLSSNYYLRYFFPPISAIFIV